MRILHIIKKEPGPEARAVIEAHSASHDVTVIELQKGFEAESLLKEVERAEKVFCW